MASTQHTPGPWTCHSGRIYTDGPTVWPKGGDLGIPIADINREKGNGTAPVERDENARLIAAAPDLLEACEAIAKLADGQGMRNLMTVAGQASRAIEKAKPTP